MSNGVAIRPVILLDMDGVLANFVQGLIDTMKLDTTHDQWSSWSHHKTIGISDDEMWASTKFPAWWENLDPYPWASRLVSCLRGVGDVIFCTSPSLCDSCPSQKVAWLRSHELMHERKNDYQIGPRKELNAKSGAILIDDSDDNIRKYRDAGGTAILFPQPWNERSHVKQDKVFYIVSLLDRLLNGEKS